MIEPLEGRIKLSEFKNPPRSIGAFRPVWGFRWPPRGVYYIEFIDGILLHCHLPLADPVDIYQHQHPMTTRNQKRPQVELQSEQNLPFHSSQGSQNSDSFCNSENGNTNNIESQNQFLPALNHRKDKRPTHSEKRADASSKHCAKHQKQSKQQQGELPELEVCLLHHKPLDILCLMEKVMICSSCALFGDHKGHEFKNTDDIERDILKREELVLSLVQKKLGLDREKIDVLNPQVVDELLNNKKKEIVSKLNAQIDRVVKEIKECQKSCLSKIEEEFNKSKQKYKGTYQKLLSSQKVYDQWEEMALNHIQSLQKSKSLQEKVKGLNINFPESRITKQGKRILSDLQLTIQDAQKQRNRCVNNVEITIDTSLITKLRRFARVETVFERELNLVIGTQNGNKNNNISMSSIENILDEPLIVEDNVIFNIKSEASLLSLETSMRSNYKSPLYRSSGMLSPGRGKMLRQEMSSQNKNRYRSPTKPQTPLQVARYRRIKLKLPEKYDRIMEQVLADTTETFDLTSGELGNEMTLQMLQLLKTNNKVRTVKLSKNKLNDDILPSLWKNLTRVQTLNLSNNNLTEKVIDSFMSNLQLVPVLKNIVITQNKLALRVVKSKIEQLRQIGVLVTL